MPGTQWGTFHDSVLIPALLLSQHDPKDMAALVLRRLRALTEHKGLLELGT